MREIRPTLFPSEAAIMKEKNTQTQKGVTVESGTVPVGDKQVAYSYCDFEKQVSNTFPAN